jgi:hypothetical protein
MITLSMIINGSLTLAYNVSVFWGGAEHNFDAGNWMYTKPWSRMGAYFVGALLGFGFFEYTSREKIPELTHTTLSKLFEFFKSSRVFSVVSFIMGVGITALYVFPLRSFLIE